MNDLTENVKGAKLVIFIDDTKLLITGIDEFDCPNKIINVMRDFLTLFVSNQN
jgi:hypothetical protein